MLIYALFFLLGIVIFSLKSSLEISTFEWGVFFALFCLFLALFKSHKKLSVSIGVFTLGFAWMGVFSHSVMESYLDEKFLNKSILVKGHVFNLAQQSHDKSRFVFSVNQPFNARVQLSWYGKNLPLLTPGDQYQLLVKLKHNNSYQNIAGFDYEKHLFSNNIHATGYVKKSIDNQFIANSGLSSIHTIRENIRQSIQPVLQIFEFSGVMNALIIGDRSLISDNHWQLFQSTNTTHLSVISGLHIGLVAGLVFWLSQQLWRLCPRCLLYAPSQIFASYLGLISALSYAVVAGFSVPTQRALIMAGVVFISIILRRNHNIWQLYGLALLLVLMLSPLSVYSIGFWLSFYVVAIIIYAAKQHQNRSYLFRLIYIQLLITIGTMPLVAWFFGVGSIFSPIANLIAIPVFSIIATPFSLIGAVMTGIGLDSLAQYCFMLVNETLALLSIILNFLSQLDFNTWDFHHRSSVGLILLILLVAVLLSPSGLKFNSIALGLILWIVFWPTPKVDFAKAKITFLDVGQGLSIVVKTQHHTMLFDTGASYASGFSLGDRVVTPFLKASGVKQIDKLIISHGDNDHIGGLESILENFEVKSILTSAGEKIKQQSQSCQSGQKWRWDGIDFEILNPNINHSLKGNNASCVLKISNENLSVLLSADIEKKAEKYLVKTLGNKLKSDVLLAPHHGSKTSSSPAFLAAVDPKIVVISSGYKNRFKHPAPIVVNRYENLAIKILNTSCSGQIDILLGDQLTIQQYRKENARFYMRQC